MIKHKGMMHLVALCLNTFPSCWFVCVQRDMQEISTVGESSAAQHAEIALNIELKKIGM